MKLELGGGTRARGDGFVNVDITHGDIIHDLRDPLPFDDDSVTEVYTCHCLEHVPDPNFVLSEIARVCCEGAPVEIRVPAPASDMAMVYDHKYVFSPIQAINMERYFPDLYWTGPKRLKLEWIEYHPSILLEEFRAEMPLFARLSDEAVMKWFPRTCHECRFFYTCVKNEHVLCDTR